MVCARAENHKQGADRGSLFYWFVNQSRGMACYLDPSYRAIGGVGVGVEIGCIGGHPLREGGALNAVWSKWRADNRILFEIGYLV